MVFIIDFIIVRVTILGHLTQPEQWLLTTAIPAASLDFPFGIAYYHRSSDSSI